LGQDVGWGERETIADFGRVLTQYVDLLVFRGKKHAELEHLAQHCNVPVINGLTDYSHPCQALADLMTIKELTGSLAGQKLAYVGDGNNVLRSLVIGCAMLGVELSAACPAGYRLEEDFVRRVAKIYPSMKFDCVADPHVAVKNATAVYTDVWASMGQESEKLIRQKVFADYQVNSELMQTAGDAIFLHCLPAHRGEEVTSDVIDSKCSAVVQQAANRMHVQKGVMVWLLGRTV
jgi:ornithine carbamoyltransferase